MPHDVPKGAAAPSTLVARLTNSAPLPPIMCSPADTYAWVPGSTVCVRCTDGVAHLHTEGASLPAASAGELE